VFIAICICNNRRKTKNKVFLAAKYHPENIERTNQSIKRKIENLQPEIEREKLEQYPNLGFPATSIS
jgi:hypothetical protein